MNFKAGIDDNDPILCAKTLYVSGKSKSGPYSKLGILKYSEVSSSFTVNSRQSYKLKKKKMNEVVTLLK